VTPVDGISSVYIRANRVPSTSVTPEYLCFMSASVGSQHGVLVKVVGISATSARVVWGEAKRIKVLGHRDNWVEIVVISICWLGKAFFNDLASYRYRMRGL